MMISGLYLVCFSIFLLYLYTSRNYNYWKKRGIPYVKPLPFFGNVLGIYLIRQSIGDLLRNIYDSFSRPFAGFFICDQPALVVRDRDVIKSILVKDFDHFYNRTVASNINDDPMGSYVLFLIRLPDWRPIRRKITPVFTSGKMRSMYDLMLESGKEMLQYLNEAAEADPVVETRELLAKYTTNLITTTAFGINAGCFKDENAPFRVVSRRIFNWNCLSRGIATTSYFVAPSLVKWFKIRFIDSFSSSFLREVFWKTIKERESSHATRHDLIDILIEIRKQENIDDSYKLEGDKLVAQATQFFIAGYETTSSTISFALYELALHPEIQSKLREEIISFKKKDGELTYDNLKQMTYLEMCVKETLRKYPVLPFLDRRCAQNYKVPGYDFIIEKGIPVYISTLGLHYNPEYFPEPEEFLPERFNDENIEKIPAFSYLPFGEGPRNCIGARFGMLGSKSGLAHIISQFEVKCCEETPNKLKCNPNGFLLAPVKGLRLRFERLEN